MADIHVRCSWCGKDKAYQKYHDLEWGVPCRDDNKLFEFLILESAQAGLSWLTILRKRDNYRLAFANFDVKAVSTFGDQEKQRLMQDSGIVRNRLKIESAIINAQCFFKVQKEAGSFSHYLWSYFSDKPIVNRWENEDQIPVSTPISHKISKDMKRRGFKFFGATTCYAYLQAMGLVNDHVLGCFRHPSQITR
ncbi:DNA-3-methyladenine glycosylase I [bacterium]|nr:DNA-3-methyladenine glycosylase I [bacterium]MDB2649683.1 DNA-3-methyladenine glycosylase I [Porticoccaceae bacterium]